MLVVAAIGLIVWGLMLVLIPLLPGYVARMAGGYDYGGRDSAEWRPDSPPPIEKGFTIPDSAIDYTENGMAFGLRPARVLLKFVGLNERFPTHEKLVAEYTLARTGSSPSSAELAELRRKEAEIRERYPSDPHFLRAAERLTHAGVECEFGGQGDMCGEFAVLRLTGSAKSLPLLEAMAADDCGLTGLSERAEAAERFRIFVLRNQSRDWRANRAIYPDVGGSPYHESVYGPEGT